MSKAHFIPTKTLVTIVFAAAATAAITVTPTTAKAGTYKWVPTANGAVPKGAFVGGQEGQRKLVICRARHKGGVHPGKVVGRACNIGWGGREIKIPRYEVLVLEGVNPAKGKPAPKPVASRWVPYGGEYEPPVFTKEGNLVTATGLIKGKNYGHVWTLPKGLAPKQRLVFNVNNHAKSARLDVLPDGKIVWVAGGKDHGWLSLAGIRFSLKPGGKLRLASGWRPYGGAYAPPTFTKQGNVVSVSGLIKGGRHGHLATLPKGMTPKSRLIFNLNNHVRSARIDVLPDGRILWVAGGRDHGWLSLSGITFNVAPQAPVKLASGWVAYGKGYAPAMVSRQGNLVTASGLIKSGKHGHMGTLPKGYAPPKRLVFTINNHQNQARVDVLPDGRMLWIAGAKDHGWVSLAGIVFKTNQPPPKPTRKPVASNCFGKNIFYTTTGRGDAPTLGFRTIKQTATACAAGTITHVWAGIGSWSEPMSYKATLSVKGKAYDQGVLQFSARSPQGYDKSDKKPTHNMAGAKLKKPIKVNAGDKVTVNIAFAAPKPPKKERPAKPVKRTYKLKFGKRSASGYDSSGKNPVNNMVAATLDPGIDVRTGQSITVTIAGKGGEKHDYGDGHIRMTLRDAKNNIIYGRWNDARTLGFSRTHKEIVAADRSGTITKFHAGIGSWSRGSKYDVTIDTNPVKVPPRKVNPGEMHRYKDGNIRMTLQGTM